MTGETAGSPMTYTSIMLWSVALDSKITNYSVNNAAYQHINNSNILSFICNVPVFIHKSQ